MMRRFVDLLAAVLGLVLLSPLLLLIAALISIDSVGSPLYGGLRIGKNGRPFRMWKFRTMVHGADRLGGITAPNDSRVTRLGAYLRRTKLDELPQLLNLLTGELTLIGPRAEVPQFVARYTTQQCEVLSVKPGITGPGQIYYTTDQADSIPAGVAADDYYVEHLLGPKLRMDLDYLRRRTALSDLQIMIETVAVLGRALVGRRAGRSLGDSARGDSLPSA